MIAAKQAIDDAATLGARSPSVIVVGCGRSCRRDDQIGLLIADALIDDPPPNTTIIKSEAPGTDLLTEVSGADLVIVLDAGLAGEQGPPGRWRRFETSRDNRRTLNLLLKSLRARPVSSAHLLGICDALAIGRDLGLLPPEMWFYVVSAADFGYGNHVSPALQRSIRDVAWQIRTDVRRWLARRSAQHA